jgi:hypothetical protein
MEMAGWVLHFYVNNMLLLVAIETRLSKYGISELAGWNFLAIILSSVADSIIKFIAHQ